MNYERILITGASSGLGFELALALALPGKTLFLAGQNLERLQALETIIQEKGAKAVLCQGNLLVKEERERLSQIIQENVPDLIIMNAGIGAYGYFADLPLQKTLEILQINVEAVIDLTYSTVQALLRAQKGGKIVFISSLAAFVPFPGNASYSASKVAILSFANGLRYELEGKNIRVLTVCPGQFATNFRKRASFENIQDPGTSLEAKKCAAAICRNIEKKEGVFIPFFRWKMLFFLSKLIPERWIASILCRRILSRTRNRP
jgi:uncharacterized protein